MNETLLAADLLAHRGFLRALARSLVGEDRADDLVQDTYVAALEHPPQGVRSIRGWLAGVLRHRVARDRRQSLARGDREQRAARSEALEIETTALLDLGRDVVEAVRALDEPYRSAIVLRYHEGLTPTGIARRLDLPVPTVNSRLARARGMLRTRLDQQHGGRTRCQLALLALARRRVALTVPIAVPIVLTALATVFLLVASLDIFGVGRIKSRDTNSIAALGLQDPPSARPARIVGQVRLPDGVAASSVIVRVIKEEDDELSQRDRWVREWLDSLGNPDPDGRFDLEVRAGVRIAVIVAAPETRAFTRIGTIPAGDVWDLGLITLNEGAVMEGRVLLGPAATRRGLIRFVRGGASTWSSRESVAQHPVWLNGRVVQPTFEVPFDHAGRFRAAGLEAGVTYAIDVIPAVEAGESPSGRLTHWAAPRRMETTVTAPSSGLEFNVPTRAVTLNSSLEGRRVPSRLGRLDGQPSRWRAVVVAGDMGANRVCEGSLPLVSDAPTVLLLDPARAYEFQLNAPGCLPLPLTIASGEEDLILAPAFEHDGPLPRLEFDLPGLPDGMRVSIEIEAAQGQRDQLLRVGTVQDERLTIDDLFASEFFLRVAPVLDPQDGASWRVPANRTVTLVAGETTRVRADLTRGGRLMVSATDDLTVVDRLLIKDGAGRVVWARRRYDWDDPRSQDLVLPSGEYLVTLESMAGESESADVLVSTGEVTRVRFPR